MYLGRYAPSPTGDLHVGNAFAAVCAWARARRAGGRCLLRIEDLDTPRVVAGSAERIVEDLMALGLTFDGDALVQSRDLSPYHDALARLRAAGALYACRCSRRDLARAASAPHEGDEGPPYPGTCRDLGLPFDEPAPPVAWRFRMPAGVVTVDDALQGPLAQDVRREVGDVVVRRKDGLIAYQLAVVVDDLRQRVTEVVRGRDLLSSAPRQAQLCRALGATPPSFAHVPLLVDGAGARVAKRSMGAELTLRALFARGLSSARVLGMIGRALGVCEETASIDAATLAARLDDDVLRRATVTWR
ncbi:MAG: tRNA glutamyl-Q(34) synthetase GluQRS [Deltaproteobacteria bacterium RBG_16_71_12]|nr:MAG: tRNA glutamyl-Q(34) synthetase GluQRS [Deltaproteobacteria bacterium RBG_16_71_12]